MKNERERLIEDLLAQQAASSGEADSVIPPASPPCPDLTELMEVAMGEASAERAGRVRQHLPGCAYCTACMAAYQKVLAEEPEPEESLEGSLLELLGQGMLEDAMSLPAGGTAGGRIPSPSMSPDWKNSLLDLILAYRESQGHPRLSREHRDQLEADLTYVLARPAALAERARYLDQQKALDPLRQLQKLDEATTEQVLRSGLSVLPDEMLARLGLAPQALRILSLEMEERSPEAWLDVLHDAAAELMREHGKTVPPLSEILPDPAPSRKMVVVSALEGTEEASAERRWKLELPAAECEWLSSSPEGVPGRSARVEMRWSARSAELTLEASGLLRLGPGYQLRARWLAADGTGRARGELLDQIDVLRLPPATNQAPEAGDILELEHIWTPPTGSGWHLRLTLGFPEETTPGQAPGSAPP